MQRKFKFWENFYKLDNKKKTQLSPNFLLIDKNIYRCQNFQTGLHTTVVNFMPTILPYAIGALKQSKVESLLQFILEWKMRDQKKEKK